jgi:hypothetical protein
MFMLVSTGIYNQTSQARNMINSAQLPQKPQIYHATERLFVALEQLEWVVQQKNAAIIAENAALKAKIYELEQQYNELYSVSKAISDKLDGHIERLAIILKE